MISKVRSMELHMILTARVKCIAGRFVFGAALVAFGVPFSSAQSSAGTAPTAGAAPTRTLDYEFFKTRVEPIFLKQRTADHARCYACHEKNHHDNKNFRLETLAPGSTFWTEEQSRRNFQIVSQLVFLANPSKSQLLLKPLDPREGGATPKIHSGGSQFASKSDPDWLILEEWAKGGTVAGNSSAR
jgi:hypothetical protein